MFEFVRRHRVMSFTYTEVKNAGIIDEDVLEYVPSTCDGEYGCGSELEFTDNLTQIGCPNRFCTHKVASRLESMAKEMKADGWGISTCLAVVKAFKLKSPAQVFLLETVNPSVMNGIVPAFDKKVKSICDPEKRKVQLWQVVKLMNIPGLSMNAMKIFEGYNTIEDAYKDIEEKQVPFIMTRLGISKQNESSAMAVNYYETLLEYKEELIAAQHRFEVFKPEGDILKIAITGGVNGYTNKGEFIRYINKIGEGKYLASLMNTVSAAIDILVADGDTSSNKYKAACKINQKAGYDKIQIVDGDGCIEYLKNKYKIQ